jgi:hypothetical protein
MQRQWLIRSLASTAVIGLLAVGCGDDDDDASDASSASVAEDEASAGAAGLDTYCEVSLDVETAPPPDVDFASATEEEIGAALQAHAEDVMLPVVTGLADEDKPEEVAAEIEVLIGAVEEQASTGDPSVWDRPEVVDANAAVHAFDLESCGWSSVEVAAADYSFDGVPDELPAGVTSFELTNDGTELHELFVFRREDGGTAPVEELLEQLMALPEEEAMELVTPQGEPAFAAPGEESYAVVDLAPGEYVAVCFIPVGTTGEDGPPAEGPPHAVHGMVAGFTVT